MRHLTFLIFLFSITTCAQCFVNESEYVQNHYTIYTSSGNSWIDQSFYQQNQYLANTMGLYVQVGYYDDSHTGPNAFAMPSDNYYIDGQTYFGLNMLSNYLITGGTNATYYVLWILSHEYAHILQYKKGGTIWQRAKWNELQADFIAGSIAAKNILENNSQTWDQNSRDYYTYQYSQVAVNFFQSLGDTNFGSSGHHGTPTERALAFAAGLNYGFQYGVTVYSDGYNTYYTLLVDYIWEASKQYINDL